MLGVVALSPLAAHAAAGATAADGPAAVRRYVVEPGDTLWSIGVKLAGRGQDPRPVVDELQSANHLDGVIVPGETLRLP